MAFGIPSAWGQAPGKAAAPKLPSSTIWGQPATRSNGIGGFTLPKPQAGTGGLTGPQTVQSSPQQPGLSPAAPQAIPAATPASQVSPQPASPLDSTYFNNLAANQFKVGNQINSLNQASGNDKIALQSALDQLAYQQPRDSLKLEQGANRTGGLYSSVYDQNLGDLQHSYQNRQDTATRTNQQQQDAIQSQIGALQGGVPLYEAQQYDDAVARAIKAAAADPATGQAPLTDQQVQYINAGLNPVPAAPPAPAAPSFTSVKPPSAPSIGGVRPGRAPAVPKLKAPKGTRTGFSGGPVFVR